MAAAGRRVASDRRFDRRSRDRRLDRPPQLALTLTLILVAVLRFTAACPPPVPSR